jgi:excisionase family DNA binding protein
MAAPETTIAPLTLTKEQAAAALNVPVDTLLNQTRIGNLASMTIGKHQRWLLADLQEYVQNQRGNETCARAAG